MNALHLQCLQWITIHWKPEICLSSAAHNGEGILNRLEQLDTGRRHVRIGGN
jgi:hypothetical protein